ncbi:pyridoxal phosphate-dependent transferase [Aspergillus lucknowensis]|uniref:Pyridoxal phosphate-dependent transferase n=1 Tax=Aspergillus lucknowensis TaxID=176173 RepID=A0ABR4LCZ3_9EURO
MDHDKRVDKYFATRTKGQNGVLKDILWAPNNSHTIMVGDNDYLNLVHHREVLTKQAEDLMNCTVYRDTVKSSVFLSDFDPHTALEQDVGAWYGKGCYFAQSGYAANVGVMHAVCTPGMHVYVDTFLHMSFYDGLASRRAKVHAFKTNDAADLEKKIAKYGPGLIIVESVYSTSGAFAPLEDIVRVKKAHNCLLVVDESHSFGLFGTEGRGLLHVKGLVNDVDYVTVSLAKAYATRAGLVFTKHALYVKENSYPYIFSSGLVQNDIVRLRAIWEVIKAADDRRERLINVATFFRSEMNKVAKVVGGLKNTPCAIVGVLMKDEEQLASLHRFLSNKGILAAPFIAPATSPDFPILRFTVHCDISMKDAVVVTQAVKEWTLQSKASAKAKL